MSKGDFIRRVFRMSHTYDRLARSEKRDDIVRFGVSSIVYSIIFLAAMIGAAFLIKTMTTDSGMALVGIILTVCCVLIALPMLLYAVVALIYQFRINKRAIRWVALVLLILALIAAVVAVILVLNGL